MNLHSVMLYGCAAVVVVVGVRVLAAIAVLGDRDTQETRDTGETSPPQALLRAWRRPLPWAAALLVAVMVAFGIAQLAAPGVIDALERQPHGDWWRAGTALLVQSSGWFQILFNLAALVAVAPVAERHFGPVRTLMIFVLSGVTAQAVSMSGWSPTGGGDSVAICGLVGALATWYALRGTDLLLRRTAPLVPLAGLVLCLLTNNHGVGLLMGSLLGAGLALPARRPLAA
ncbi:rhomboid family intramembrane serine protease [Streptomyces sp. NPDC059524]|uniref:rhomboid family intramembrane serine protease n=1 Tax=Streptomyces sp. NPDC059524 TaxID=3346856 RepID=UPI0036C314ED